MGYKLTIHFSDGSAEEVDDVFETDLQHWMNLTLGWTVGKSGKKHFSWLGKIT